MEENVEGSLRRASNIIKRQFKTRGQKHWQEWWTTKWQMEGEEDDNAEKLEVC